MAEIEITLPTVQYGNVKVRATPEELGLSDISDSHALGVAAAVYLNLFSQGFKVGAQMDVSAPVGASREAVPGDPQAAADRLAGGRSPRTVDEANEMAKQVIEAELGGVTEVEEYDSATEAKEAAQARTADKPWDQPQAEAKKPWETDGVTAPAVLDALGDGW